MFISFNNKYFELEGVSFDTPETQELWNNINKRVSALVPVKVGTGTARAWHSMSDDMKLQIVKDSIAENDWLSAILEYRLTPAEQALIGTVASVKDVHLLDLSVVKTLLNALLDSSDTYSKLRPITSSPGSITNDLSNAWIKAVTFVHEHPNIFNKKENTNET